MLEQAWPEHFCSSKKRNAPTKEMRLEFSDEMGRFLQTVARAPRSVLLLDYDGTLAPFSIDREQAVPYAGVREVLQEILDAERTRLIVITGRNAHEINPLLQINPPLEVWGCHGQQHLQIDGTSEMHPLDPNVAQALEDAERWMAYQGLQAMVEAKPTSVAVHWRGLSETDAVELRGRILLGWFPIADRGGLSVVEFDGGIELRLAHRDKSDAVQTILQQLDSSCPVAFLGDDVTDERAFRALAPYGLTVLVRSEYRRTAAQFWLRPPEELLDFLSRWRDACRPIRLAQTAT